jgi:hypothetical protein
VKTFPPLVLNSGEFTPVRAGCPGAAGERIMALYEDRSIRADDCSIRSSWRRFGVGCILTQYTASELVGVAGFEPAASSSRSQVAQRLINALLCLTWGRASVDVRWRPQPSVVIVTQLVTRSFTDRFASVYVVGLYGPYSDVGHGALAVEPTGAGEPSWLSG